MFHINFSIFVSIPAYLKNGKKLLFEMSYFELNLCPQLQALIYNYFISAIGLKILLSNTKKPEA